LIVLDWIEGSSERKEGKEWSGNELVLAPRGELNLSAEVDNVREVIPDDLFS
jgi:hypothetical protein